MKLFRFILTFSLILNLGTQAAISCDMKACKISKKVASCCKKETTQQVECCCAKMKCKTTTKYNDVLVPVVDSAISFQYWNLATQDVMTPINQIIPFRFSATYFHWANPPTKNNIPLLT
ncbi:MAG: hypothetical protein HN820_02630 [Candidatus Marinimicrobia bacterium]|jgi:hypothetical protein|nr:hypothetical protein [Candidatus Neomarinimicrobiota bacterium]